MEILSWVFWKGGDDKMRVNEGKKLNENLWEECVRRKEWYRKDFEVREVEGG